MSQPQDPPDDTTSPVSAPARSITEYQGYVDVEYLRRAEELVRQDKRHTYELMRVRPGQRVLDLGCGPGIDTIPMAQIVGPSGHVVGVDYDPDMLVEAARRAQEAGVAGWAQHLHADATALPLEPDTFDACRSERLFQHLSDPAAALSEMVRVTKPGGWVVVLDADWGTLTIDTAETDIERRLVRFHSEAQCRNGRVGRQLYRLFKRQGLEDVSVEGIAWIAQPYTLFRALVISEDEEQTALEAGVVTEDELRRWRAALAQADDEGAFLASVQVFIAVGRKP